ncbi:MAG TPA: hypothetical protein PKN75_13005 [Bacteroidia bacterium]|nr:hypothetical protein [Bacteroidia bacterium]HNU34499.1 hypothetical protein [Bacteroidia bacterium]
MCSLHLIIVVLRLVCRLSVKEMFIVEEVFMASITELDMRGTYPQV